MNVLVATDGSAYGRWELNWVAKLPFVEPPRVTVLHVGDISALRAPFLSQPVVAGSGAYIQEEIERMEVRAAQIITDTKKQFVALKLMGTVRKEQGAVAPVILKCAPKRDGLLVVGSQGLDALDRFMLGSVSTKLIHHATCPVLVVKGEAAPLRRIILVGNGWIGCIGQSIGVCAEQVSAGSFDRQWRARADSCERDPCDAVGQVPGAEGEGEKLIEQSVRKLVKAGFTAEPVCRLGKPVEEIMNVASHQQADLIVMGAKGMGAIARFLLGSISTRVVQHANYAVLVVR